MFSEFAMQNLGYRTGVRANELETVAQLNAEGKTAQEISDHMRVELACIESLLAYPGDNPIEAVLHPAPDAPLNPVADALLPPGPRPEAQKTADYQEGEPPAPGKKGKK